jgi:hypothetical protein
MTELVCSWCRKPVADDDGFRLYDGDRFAVFCRLEHVVPWQIQGRVAEVRSAGERTAEGECAQCGEPASVVLVRHRGEHRIPDSFCSVEHAAAWAKAGGRWR